MSVLQKGVMVVLLSTVVASVLILQINNSAIGENKVDPKALMELESSGAKETDIATKSAANTSNDALTTLSDANTSVDSVLKNKAKNNVVNEQDGLAFLPPPGPFIQSNKHGGINMNAIRGGAPSAPASPKAPLQDPVAKKVTELNTKSLEKTASEIIEPSKPKALVSPSIKSVKPAEPKVAEDIAKKKAVSSKIEAPKAQTRPQFKGVIEKPSAPAQKNKIPSQVVNLNRSPQAPIWMQKAPDLNALRNQPQKSKGRQINNQRPNFPAQRYIVVPTRPMYAPNYSYPQAPVYGGSYYYAPTQPQYNMMPPVMSQPSNKLIQPERSPNEGSTK